MFSLVFAVIIGILLIAGIVLIVKPVVLEDEHAGTESKTPSRIAGGIVVVLTSIILVFMSVASVGATQVGVPITLGKPGSSLTPGPHLVLPWTSVKTLDVKTQAVVMDDDANVRTITSDRIQVPVDVTLFISVNKEKAPTLLLTVGEDYVEKIVVPVARGEIYDQGAKFSSENIQAERDAYEQAVFENLKPVLATRGVNLEKVELRKIQIPDEILNNAQAKVTAEEKQKRAKIDAETAQIEAEGKAKANAIVSGSISKNPAIICNNFVDGLRNGSISGPIYINPCSTGSGGGPNLLIQPTK
jgi:regulator of protease activity HflC (stomatin/prohibitin superfamily)